MTRPHVVPDPGGRSPTHDAADILTHAHRLCGGGGFDRSGRDHVIPIAAGWWSGWRSATRCSSTSFVITSSHRLSACSARRCSISDGRTESATVRPPGRAMRPTVPSTCPWLLGPARGAGGCAAGLRLGIPRWSRATVVSLWRCPHRLRIAARGSGARSGSPDGTAGDGDYGVHRLSSGLARCTAPRGRVVPFGIDAGCFSVQRTPPKDPRGGLLHVASLNPVKDQATLLRAFQR